MFKLKINHHAAARLGAVVALAFATEAAGAELTREQASDEVKTLAPYRVMSEHYPAEFEKMLALLVKESKKGRSVREVALDNNPVMSELMSRQLPKTSASNALLELQYTIVEAKAAAAVKPKYCLAVLGMSKSDRPFDDYLPPDLAVKQMELAADVLLQTATAPEAPPPPIDGKLLRKITEDAYFSLPNERLRAAFNETGDDPSRAITPLQQTAHCQLAIGILEQILALPPAEAAVTYRSFAVDGS